MMKKDVLVAHLKRYKTVHLKIYDIYIYIYIYIYMCVCVCVCVSMCLCLCLRMYLYILTSSCLNKLFALSFIQEYSLLDDLTLETVEHDSVESIQFNSFQSPMHY